GVIQRDRCRARCGSIDDLTTDHHAEVSAQKIAITLKCPQDVMAITAWRERRVHVFKRKRWPSGPFAPQKPGRQSHIGTGPEIAYRCSRLDRADCGPDAHHPRASGAGIPGELVIRI